MAAKRLGWSQETVRDWYTKPARRETPTVAALTTSLIDGIDSMLGVLDAQAGTYTVTRNTIRFEDPARPGSTRRCASGSSDRGSARRPAARDQPGPMSYLLQAIGTTRLPLAS